MATHYVKKIVAASIFVSMCSAAPAAFAQSLTEDAENPTQTVTATETSEQEVPSASSATTKTSNPVSPSSATTTAEKDMQKASIDVTAKSSTSENKTTISATVTYKGLEAKTKYQVQFTATDDKGDVVLDRQPVEFTPTQGSGEKEFTLTLDKAVSALSLSKVEIVTEDGTVVASLEKAVKVSSDEQGTDGKTMVKTSAGLDTDVIQTGAKVSDTITYEGFIPGEKYTVETQLMCKATDKDTGAKKTSDFTAENASGEFTVQDIEIADPDCLEQVVFETIKDANGKTVAEHKDINDKAQTVGGGQLSKKKKKKDAPAPTTKVVPVAPALGGTGGGNGTPQRDTIGNVPSGEFSAAGSTIFTR